MTSVIILENEWRWQVQNDKLTPAYEFLFTAAMLQVVKLTYLRKQNRLNLNTEFSCHFIFWK